MGSWSVPVPVDQPVSLSSPCRTQQQPCLPLREASSGRMSKMSTPSILPRISRRSRPVACSRSVGTVPGAAPGPKRSSSVLISVGHGANWSAVWHAPRPNPMRKTLSSVPVVFFWPMLLENPAPMACVRCPTKQRHDAATIQPKRTCPYQRGSCSSVWASRGRRCLEVRGSVSLFNDAGGQLVGGGSSGRAERCATFGELRSVGFSGAGSFGRDATYGARRWWPSCDAASGQPRRGARRRRQSVAGTSSSTLVAGQLGGFVCEARSWILRNGLIWQLEQPSSCEVPAVLGIA